MSTPIIDNFRYNGRRPDFERQEYIRISDLAAIRDNRMPDLYLVYCLEDRSVYLYDKSAGVSTVTGKCRKFQPGNSIQVTEMPLPTEEFNNRVVQYIGITDADFTKGYFYNCHYLNEEITTVNELKNIIIKYGDTIDNVKAISYEGVEYFIQDNIVYKNLNNPVEVTDVDLGFTISTYVWEYLETSKQKDPAIIPNQDIDDLFITSED